MGTLVVLFPESSSVGSTVGSQASQKAGQAGVGSILSLELHRGWAICPRNEVVLWEATGLDVVLQQLLGEVLVHLCSLMGIHGVPTCLV